MDAQSICHNHELNFNMTSYCKVSEVKIKLLSVLHFTGLVSVCPEKSTRIQTVTALSKAEELGAKESQCTDRGANVPGKSWDTTECIGRPIMQK